MFQMDVLKLWQELMQLTDEILAWLELFGEVESDIQKDYLVIEEEDCRQQNRSGIFSVKVNLTYFYQNRVITQTYILFKMLVFCVPL